MRSSLFVGELAGGSKLARLSTLALWQIARRPIDGKRRSWSVKIVHRLIPPFSPTCRTEFSVRVRRTLIGYSVTKGDADGSAVRIKMQGGGKGVAR